MFRSLANRLTLWYAAVAVSLVICVALIFTAVAFSSVAANANQTIAQTAREAQDLLTVARGQGQTLSQAAPRVVQEMARGGMRVSVIDSQGRLLGGVAPNDAYPHERFGLAIMSLLGVTARQFTVSGRTIIVGPDPSRIIDRLQHFWKIMALVSILVAVVVWFAFRAITSRALHPLVEVTLGLRRFGEGDFKSRFILDSARHDELADLAAAYNSAVDQVSSAFAERQKAEQQMGQFIADAGHQLRTPLTVVMGFVDVLRKGPPRDPETANRIFDAMTVESRRMRSLIDKLVLLARLEGTEYREVVPFDVAALVSATVESLRRIHGGERLELQTSPPALVRADKGEIQEAISNLLDNALKYAPNSPVNVGVGASNGSVTVHVQDFGPGITADEQKRIFDRFYRGSAREGVDGSGLGLAIVKRAVERAHGRLFVSSQNGEGTTFVMELPRTSM